MPYLIKAEQKFPYYYAKTGEFFSSKNSATRIPTLEKAQDYLEEVKLLCPNCKAQIVEFEDKKYNETPEQRQKRLESNKKSKMKMLANETPEQREKRLERQRQANKRQVARETPEQRKERLERSRQYQRNKLANETPEQREKRLEKRRQYDFTRRQNNV